MRDWSQCGEKNCDSVPSLGGLCEREKGMAKIIKHFINKAAKQPLN
jgi:hypothetical protein